MMQDPRAVLITTALTGTLDLAVDMDADQWGSLIQTTPGSGVW